MGGIAAADLFPLTSFATIHEAHLAQVTTFAATDAAGALVCRRRYGRESTYAAIGRRRPSQPLSREGLKSALAHLCGHSRRPGCICPARAGHAAAASTPCRHAETPVSEGLAMDMTELEGATRRLGPRATGLGELTKFEGTTRCLGPLVRFFMARARAQQAAAATSGRPLRLAIPLNTDCAVPMLSGTP